ncbi:NUDIX domain-containing protein [soil metagenome]
MLEQNDTFPYFNGDFADAVHQFEKGLGEEIILNVPDLEAALERVKACYHKVIFAAGGLVKNPEGKYLFIHRLDKWDLPKGKVEHGESMDTAALREVEEETGLQNITLGSLLIKTFHTYPHKGHQVIKETHWYAMTAPEQPLTPQAEEDITQALWIKPAELDRVLADTYGNIALVAEAGRWRL